MGLGAKASGVGSLDFSCFLTHPHDSGVLSGQPIVDPIRAHVFWAIGIVAQVLGTYYVDPLG